MDKEIVCACYCRIGHDIEEKEKSRKKLTKKDISRLVREVPADFLKQDTIGLIRHRYIQANRNL